MGAAGWSVVVQILYAAIACWDYTLTTISNELMPNLTTFEEQGVSADEKLFNNILQHPCNTPHVLLPLTAGASQHYSPNVTNCIHEPS